MKNWPIWILSLVAAIGLTIALAVVNRQTSTRGLEIDGPIPVVLKSTVQATEFWDVVWSGVLQASREFGVEVEKFGPPREKDIDVQVRIVAELIESRPPVIILAATDFHRFARLVERAVSLGIPVVTFDSGVNTDAPISFVATDNVEAGRKAGAELARLIGDPDSTRIAIVSHIQETATAIDREAGVREALAGYDIAGTWFCDVDQELAYRITRDLLERPEIGGIVALNETTSLGVAEAVVDAGAAGRIKVVGFDNALMEMQYLERGVIHATVVQHPYDMGYLAMKTAYDHLAGRKVPAVIDTGSLLVTAENMFDPGYQETLFPFDAD